MKLFKFILFFITLIFLPACRPNLQPKIYNTDLNRKILLNIVECRARELSSFPKNLNPNIKETKTELKVTYPTNLPKGTLGPDYHVEITILKRSGQIIRHMVGS
jgi:hypothetical protein